MGITNGKIDNEIKLLNMLQKSYEKAVKDLSRIDKYLFGDDVTYACEDIYDRMSNVIKEANNIDGVNEENKILKNYIEARSIVLHGTLKEATDVCNKYLKEVVDIKEHLDK